MADETQTEAQTEKPAPSGQTVMCMVSKQMVALEDTVEVERKKGERLRIHKRFKKF